MNHLRITLKSIKNGLDYLKDTIFRHLYFIEIMIIIFQPFLDNSFYNIQRSMNCLSYQNYKTQNTKTKNRWYDLLINYELFFS